MNRLACFDPIWVPNSELNTKYFQIIFSNQIICPSLDYRHFPKTSNIQNFKTLLFYLLGFLCKNKLECKSRIKIVINLSKIVLKFWGKCSESIAPWIKIPKKFTFLTIRNGEMYFATETNWI